MTEQDTIKMDERIDDFLKGRMSMEEEHQFLSDLKSNKILRERAHITALLVESLKM
jgi:hypothetical protein